MTSRMPNTHMSFIRRPDNAVLAGTRCILRIKTPLSFYLLTSQSHLCIQLPSQLQGGFWMVATGGLILRAWLCGGGDSIITGHVELRPMPLRVWRDARFPFFFFFESGKRVAGDNCVLGTVERCALRARDGLRLGAWDGCRALEGSRRGDSIMVASGLDAAAKLAQRRQTVLGGIEFTRAVLQPLHSVQRVIRG